MIRTVTLCALLACLNLPAFAEDVPAVSCEGQNCMQDQGRETKECEGEDCAPPAPAQAEIECVGQDCDAIQDQPTDTGNGG